MKFKKNLKSYKVSHSLYVRYQCCIGKLTKLFLLQFSKQLCSEDNCFHVCVIKKIRQNTFKIETKITIFKSLTKMSLQRIVNICHIRLFRHPYLRYCSYSVSFHWKSRIHLNVKGKYYSLRYSDKTIQNAFSFNSYCVYCSELCLIFKSLKYECIVKL